ncbi:hypothetical protein [Sulfuricaulis limicola]|uniref:hypothetical protein n=1 Tax=Sulfuricaulis limicola TaxID=1620215 RepID=UPI0011E4CC24|nr:hypothetical protein [Sulfuricaulis limicola]
MSLDRHDRFISFALLGWAIAGVPLAFFLYVEWAYRAALSQGKLPFLGLSEWSWYAVFGVCLTSGVISLVATPTMRHRNRLLAGGLYLALMASALFAIHLVVACGKGDCL